MGDRVTSCEVMAAVEVHRTGMDVAVDAMNYRFQTVERQNREADERMQAFMADQQSLATMVKEILQQGRFSISQRKENGDRRSNERSPSRKRRRALQPSGEWNTQSISVCQRKGDGGIQGTRRMEAGENEFLQICKRRPLKLDLQTRTVLRMSRNCSSAVEAMKARFGPSSYLDYNVKLSKITQKGSVVDYNERLEELSNMVRGWPIAALIGAFVRGLKEEIQIEVQAAKPRSLTECF
ncbi:hypothetical protein EJ110_NYTH54967 [Nymphaea thermarum]|nr:hypothetical protein EJ110_NYTH54967 [Nymphaea thermarum]